MQAHLGRVTAPATAHTHAPSSIRGAIATLEAEGLVRTIQARGTFVVKGR